MPRQRAMGGSQTPAMLGRRGIAVIWIALAAATALALVVLIGRAADLAAGASLQVDDVEAVRRDAALTAQFGYTNPVVWVVAARAGTLWTPEVLAHVERLTREVMRIPGVIAPDVVSLASPNLRDLQVGAGGLRPTYLMPRVPRDGAEMAALRARIEGDPMYQGTLVDAAGQAAMVVANFRPAAPAEAIGAAARRLRAAHRDESTVTWTTGPALIASMRPVSRPLAVALVAALAAAALLLALRLGPSGVLPAAAGAVVASLGTAALLAAADRLLLPWGGLALVGTAWLAAAAVTARRAGATPSALLLRTVALLAGLATMAVAGDGGARAFALAAGVGSAAGLAVALAIPIGTGSAPPGCAAPRRRWPRIGVALGLAIAAAGLPRFDPSFGLAGYGARYLFGAEGDDLRAIARHFPPPTELAVEVSGAGGFVADPDVLRALEGVAAAARRDPAVRGATSLADLITLVHRAFNPDDPSALVALSDRGLNARYLMLAYSPGFRRFVDRALATTVVWIQLRDDDIAAARRVVGLVTAQLERMPVPGAQVRVPAGDAAALLRMADGAWRFAAAALAGLVASAAALALLAGWRSALTAAAAGALAALGVGGAAGWLGLHLDLLTLPLLVSLAFAAAGGAALRRAPGAR